MTPEKQRIAIAKACGLNPVTVPFIPRDMKSGHQGCWFTADAAAHMRSTYPHGAAPKVIPNYLSDLNAMHEAEKILSSEQCYEYRRILDSPTNFVEGVHAARYYTFNATASQRAEAFLRTLNLWKD
jgi:hypothetical protein